MPSIPDGPDGLNGVTNTGDLVSGKISVGDSPWLANGVDVPKGTTVEVTGIEGTTLQVKPVEG